MGVALLDSSTIIGFVDKADALHDAASRCVWEAAREHTFAASVISIAELLTGAQLGHQSERAVRSFFNVIVTHRFPLDEEGAERTAELRAAQRGLRLPDAAIAATADLKADVFITGDERLTKARDLSCEVRYIGAG